VEPLQSEQQLLTVPRDLDPRRIFSNPDLHDPVEPLQSEQQLLTVPRDLDRPDLHDPVEPLQSKPQSVLLKHFSRFALEVESDDECDELPASLQRKCDKFSFGNLMQRCSENMSTTLVDQQAPLRCHDQGASVIITLEQLQSRISQLVPRSLDWDKSMENSLRAQLLDLNPGSNWLRGQARVNAKAWLDVIDELEQKQQLYDRLRKGLVYLSLMRAMDSASRVDHGVGELILTKMMQYNAESMKSRKYNPIVRYIKHE